MPFVKRDMDEKTEAEREEVEYKVTIEEPAPEKEEDILLRIIDIIRFFNLEYLEVTKDRIYYRHYPHRTVQETEQLIDWYMKTVEEG